MYIVENNQAGAIYLAYNQEIIFSLVKVRVTENFVINYKFIFSPQ